MAENEWIRLIEKHISNMDANLELLTKSIYYRNQLEYYKELYSIDNIKYEDYVEVLKFIGEEQEFITKK